MRRRGRVRRAAKWAGALVSALVVAAWVVNYGYGFGMRWISWGGRPWMAAAYGGAMEVSVASGPGDPGDGHRAAWFQRTRIGYPFWMIRSFTNASGTTVRMPLWIPFVAGACPMAWCWWRSDHGPARAGLLWACGCAAPVLICALLVALVAGGDAAHVTDLTLVNGLGAIPLGAGVFILMRYTRFPCAVLAGSAAAGVQCLGIWVTRDYLGARLIGGSINSDHLVIPAANFLAAALLAAVVLGVLGLRHRRYPAGHCSACGYDLAGLASGLRCPECGCGRGG